MMRALRPWIAFLLIFAALAQSTSADVHLEGADCELSFISKAEAQQRLTEAFEEALENADGILQKGTYRIYKRRVMKSILKRCAPEAGTCSGEQIEAAFREALESIENKVEGVRHATRRLTGNIIAISAIAGATYAFTHMGFLAPETQKLIQFLIPTSLVSLILQGPYTRKAMQNVSRGIYRLFLGKRSFIKHSDDVDLLQKIDDQSRPIYTDDQVRSLSIITRIQSRIEGTMKDALGMYRSSDPVMKTATASYIARAVLSVLDFHWKLVDPNEFRITRSAQMSFTWFIETQDEKNNLYHQTLEYLYRGDPSLKDDAERNDYAINILKSWLDIDSNR